MGKAFKRFALGTLIAGVSGYIAGILTAPKSGKETRADIKEAAQTSIAEAEKRLKKLHTQLDQLIQDGQKIVATVEGKTRKELERAIAATKTTKEKARQMLSSVHEGHADNRELDAAITDATKAIEHLRTFVKSATK